MINSTQDHLLIKDIKEDLVILNDGSVVCVLQTSAVNFDLLSENEQLAIIESFAGLLNSLSFAIQIVIRSKRLDISSYLKNLTLVEDKQTNPLLKQMIERYKSFIAKTIKENEVLDKQFYIVIQASYLELGLGGNFEKHFQKANTIIIPRRDHIIRQLSRIGLKATQLTTEKLVKLFYDIYNEQPLEVIQPTVNISPLPNAPVINKPQPQVQQPIPTPQPIQPVRQPINQPIQQPNKPLYSSQRHMPFVVEELADDYSSVN